jgi:hypothetical protein
MAIGGVLAALLFAAPVNVISVGGGNALTLPAARHLVRMDPQDGRPATWLLAVQQDGAAGHWLSMYRSDDEAQSWGWYAPIQDNCCERDTPDMLPVGMDVAMVFSYEGPDITGSINHDVYFQWWRWDGGSNWNPQTPVKVFDSTSSSTAYLRGEIARDSVGRIWIWAQRLNADGSFTMVMSVSSNGGATFQAQPSLDSFADRPGGRIMPVGGGRMMLLYGTHGVDPGYQRMRSDSDPVGTWGARQVVFPEGLYHGAALSAAEDGSGGVHLVYKDVNEQLFYRHWNGSWSSAQLVEGSADWALQPAITRVDSDLVIFWNRMLTTDTDYQFYYRILDSGTLGATHQLDGAGGFKGYPASAEVLPDFVPDVPCFFGKTPDANSSGWVALTSAPTPNASPPPPPPPPPDGGVDAGPPDAGPPDAGPPDGGTGGGPTGTLFSDDFNRTVNSGLGPSWQVKTGLWRDDGQRGNSDLDGTDQASVIGLSCADCTVQARIVNFNAATAALDLRETANNDRYDVGVTSTGRLQIRRHRGSTTTVLGDVASGIADLGDWATIALTATGAGPVQLVASVNGVPKLSVTDSSASAITSAGTAGLWTTLAGIWFDDFVVTGNGDGGGAPDAGPPDAGPPDAGTPDAGPPDAGTPDAGPPDAGPPDAGPPDAGPPDAGTPDAGPPDAGPPDAGPPDAGTPDAGPPDGGGGGGTTGVIFSDDFNRTLSSNLGPKWTVLSGGWRDNNQANSDRDALDRAMAAGISCADCRIDAKMVNFAGGDSRLELRVNAGNRYALALTKAGKLEIRRYAGTAVTVLGSVASGIADLGSYHSFSFSVQGAFPVTLTGYVNGVPKLSATDSSASAYTGSGGAGISATFSGILFDNFTLTGTIPDGGGGGGSDGGTPDAGPPDAGPPDAGTPDAGTPDAGTPDAGPPDAGPPDGGGGGGTGAHLTVTQTFKSTGFDLLAVDPAGTAYGVNLNGNDATVYASSDGRSWTSRGTANGTIWMMSALSDGTLLADLDEGSGHVLARSTDHGATWHDTLSEGQYRSLSPHSFAELDGNVYFVEYQVFTTNSTPIRLWMSTDRGATWSVRFTFQGHRHGHGLMPDPAHHALFAFFGDFDAQSGLYRSTDAGASWTLIKGGTQAGDIVDGTVLSDGSFLCGQDISFQGSTPNKPQIARIGLNGAETNYVTLPSASYSTHAVRSVGGFVVGTTHEEGADVEASGWTKGTLWGSGDGTTWQQLLTVSQATAGDDVRSDVYWELPGGELVLTVRNAAGFGPGGRGYLLLAPERAP